jgi:hypothetical protein
MSYRSLGDKTVQNWIDDLDSNSIFNDLSRNQKILYIDSVAQECSIISKSNNLNYYKSSNVDLLFYRAQLLFNVKKQAVNFTVVTNLEIHSGSLAITIDKQTVVTAVDNVNGVAFHPTIKKQTIVLTVSSVDNQIEIDTYPIANTNNNHGFTTGQGFGQSFKGTGQAVKSAVFYMAQVNPGGMVGNFVSKIYAHTGTYGVFPNGSKPTGTALVASDEVSSTILGIGVNTAMRFVFSTDYILTYGTSYVITVEFLGTTFYGGSIATKTGMVTGKGNASIYNSGWSSLNEVLIFYIYSVIAYSAASLVFSNKKIVVSATVFTGSGNTTLDMSIKKQTMAITGLFIPALVIAVLPLTIKKQVVVTTATAGNTVLTITIKKQQVTITATFS